MIIIQFKHDMKCKYCNKQLTEDQFTLLHIKEFNELYCSPDHAKRYERYLATEKWQTKGVEY